MLQRGLSSIKLLYINLLFIHFWPVPKTFMRSFLRYHDNPKQSMIHTKKMFPSLPVLQTVKEVKRLYPSSVPSFNFITSYPHNTHKSLQQSQGQIAHSHFFIHIISAGPQVLETWLTSLCAAAPLSFIQLLISLTTCLDSFNPAVLPTPP